MIDNLSFGFLTIPPRPETTRGEAALRFSLTFCAVAVLAIFFSYIAKALDSPTWTSPTYETGWDQMAE